MALGRKVLTCVAIKGLTMCCVLFYCVLCVCFTVCLHCRVMQSSVQELTGKRTVLFTYSSLPPSVMLLDHQVPASNHRLGPSD
ncbi:unnamed protein product [Staurois parvus]|uniref:Secreted protein n=1 Tax=Staurois parvus TaxID=386267 RepID=A0ABN9DMV7_9NEOB|nr:unnamed protein product [Staurois parvus]